MFFDKIELNKDNKFLEKIENFYKNSSSLIMRKQDYNDITNFLLETQLKNKNNTVPKNIIIIYANPRFPRRKYDILKDTEDGIPHFFYGNSRGIINKITFREENMPYVKEANIQSQVDKKPWKPTVFIRNKYNVLIEMIGTVNFRIGSLIYISPSFPGVLDFNEPVQYGFGGYFLIVSIKSNIESGKFSTSIEANWVATGDGKYTDLGHFPIKIKKIPKNYSYY